MRRTIFAILAAGMLLPVSPVTSIAGAQVVQVTAPEVISVEFKGGTVLQYIEALKKSGKAVNIVASERAGKQQLSPVSLSQVSVGVAVFSIQAAATSGSGNWRIDVIQPPGPRFPGGTAMYSAGEAYSVDFYPLGKRGEDVVVESYSLQRIIRPESKGDGLDPKVVLTAIETGLKLQNEGTEQPPDLQFHSDSGLLFVRGSSADVRLVGSIVGRLADDAKVRAAAAEKRAAERAVREIGIKEAKLDIEVREIELEAAKANLDQAHQMADKGTLPPSEVKRMEVEFARARTNLERAKLALDRAQIVPADSTSAEERPGEAAPASPVPDPAGKGQVPAKTTKRPGGK